MSELKNNSTKLYIIRILVSLFLLVQYNFFLLVKINYLDEGISSFSLLITIILFLILNETNDLKFYNKNVIFALLFMAALAILRSIYLFPLDISRILKSYIQWSSVLVYFPLTIYIFNDKKFFLKLLVIINIIFIIILSYQVISYSVTSNLFLDGNYFLDPLTKLEKLNFRNDSLRITISAIWIVTSFLISINELFMKNNKLLNFINIILSGLYINYVIQTRALTFLIIISLVIYALIRDYGYHTLKGYLVRILLFSAVVFFIVVTKSYVALLDTYSDISDVNNQISSYARLGALEYFKNIIYENPLLGNGIYIGDVGSTSYFLAQGPQGIFFYDDLGIIGNIAQFGIMSVVVLIMYIYTNIFKTKKVYYIIPIYFILSTLTTISVINRIPILPFIISMAYIDTIKNKDRDIVR